MILTLKNIGKIKNAKIKMNGITVIAGENNTGKSTISQALFSVFNSFYKIEDKIYNERIKSIKLILHRAFSDFSYQRDLFDNYYDFNFEKISEEIIQNRESYLNNSKLINEWIIKEIKINKQDEIINYNNDKITDIVNKIVKSINVDKDDIIKNIISRNLQKEFDDQINNIFTEESGKVTLNIHNRDITVGIKDNVVFEITDSISLNTEAIYMDDPFLLDEITNRGRARIYTSNHRLHLLYNLLNTNNDYNIVDEIITNEKLNNIYNKLSSVCSGEIINNKNGLFGYKKDGSDKVLNVKRLSTGLKTFVILKKLLTNGKLEENGTIILDEPEIHLHPEWQLVFAELIVLLQKEFNLHILLNTHSPYFINALEVYSRKYDIEKKCTYYLAFNKIGFAYFEDTSENLEKIYSKLARPLQDLENEF